MIDEWCEEQIDKLCVFLPAYFGPRITKISATPLGWHLYLFLDAIHRRAIMPLTRIPWVERPQAIEEPDDVDDSDFADLDPDMAQKLHDIRVENRKLQQEKEKIEENERKKHIPIQTKIRQTLAGFWQAICRGVRFIIAWCSSSDVRWEARAKRADARNERWMKKAMPALEPIRRSRFPLVLLLMMFCVLGVCATGSGHLAFCAASACAQWLSIAFEIGYQPVCGGTRQRYLASILLRTLSFGVLLPMYFGQYVHQGVQSNIVMQSALVVMLIVHAVFFLMIVAFRRVQPFFLRLLTGILGVIPAATVAASVTLAVAYIAKPQPMLVSGILGAVGTVFLFCGDRLVTLHDLGGIRLRYEPVWNCLFAVGGLLLVSIGAWIGAL